jgi:hypothetical protein
MYLILMMMNNYIKLFLFFIVYKLRLCREWGSYNSVLYYKNCVFSAGFENYKGFVEKPLLHIWTFKTPFSQHINSNVFQIIHISIETVWTIIFFFTFILFFSCF